MVEVAFCVMVDEERWVPVTEVPPERGLALWNQPDVSCCTLQAGFLVTVDGVPFTAEALDEIGMARTWLDAVHALLQGASRARVWAWEESSLTLSRRGEVVTGLDVHHSGAIVCPRVEMPLVELAHALAGAAERADAWLTAVRALAVGVGADALVRVLDSERGGSWVEEVQALRAAAARPIPSPPPGDPGPLPPAWLAALTHDEPALRRLLEDPDLTVDGTSLLSLAIRHGWHEGVELLLSRGASAQRPSATGFTPLQQAARRANGQPSASVDALLAAGAPLDPISAVLLRRPAALAELSARGITDPETLHWVVLVVDPLTPAWEAAITAAVAAGSPVNGIQGGRGGWHERPLEAARKKGRKDLVALLERLTHGAETEPPAKPSPKN